jgi:hypothetical protein
MDERTTKEAASGTNEERPFLDFEYLYASRTGRFKIAEFFTSLLAAALVPSTVYKHGAGFSFMSWVAWSTFINVVLDIILHLVRVWDKLTFVRTYPQVLVCLYFLGSMLLCVAGAVEVGISQYAEDPGLGYASALFGFMCCVLLAIECFAFYKSYREKQQGRATEMTRAAEGPAVIQDPNFY